MQDLAGEDTALVLDTGAFNLLRREQSLLKRMRVLNPRSRDEVEAVIKDMQSESDYLYDLAETIKKDSRFATSYSIVPEMGSYSKGIKAAIRKLQDASCPWLDYRAQLLPMAIEEVISNCREHSIPRGKGIIKRNRQKFEEYLRWLRRVAERQEEIEFDSRTRVEESTEVISPITFEEYEQIFYTPKRDRTNDNDVTAVSLASACERPTILFTADIKHIARIVKAVYNGDDYGVKEKPAPPSHQYRVCTGFGEGWRIWVDSTQMLASRRG